MSAEPDREHTKDRILSAAVALFSEHGKDGVSTRDLGERAGCNIATLSYYYGAKDSLYEAAFDEVYRRLTVRLREVVSALAAETAGSTPDVHAVLARLVPKVYEAAWKERVGVRLILREVLERGRLPERIEQQQVMGNLGPMSEQVAVACGVSPALLRRAIVAGSFLLSRYVTHDEDALARSFQVDTAFEAHAIATRSLLVALKAWLELDEKPAR